MPFCFCRYLVLLKIPFPSSLLPCCTLPEISLPCEKKEIQSVHSSSPPLLERILLLSDFLRSFRNYPSSFPRLFFIRLLDDGLIRNETFIRLFIRRINFLIRFFHDSLSIEIFIIFLIFIFVVSSLSNDIWNQREHSRMSEEEGSDLQQ